ncbi:MAG: ABC transporter ATP-binding protein [Lachnospiraceae bacterium]|nr:ABC transporter ATP-binding protein [Lachnospiraceae bacterium]
MRKNGRTLGQDMGIIRRGIREFGELLPGQMGHVLVRSILAAGIPFLETAVPAFLLNELTGNRDRGRLFLLAILGAGLILALSLWRNYEDCRIETGYGRLFASHEIGLTNKAYRLPYELLEQDSTKRLRDEVSGAISLSGAGMASLYWDMDVLWTNLFAAGTGALILGGSLAGMLAGERPGGAFGMAAVTLGLGALMAVSSFVACRMTGKRFDVSFDLFLKGARYARYGDYYHMNYLPDEDAAMDARIYSQEKLILDQCQTKCYERLAEGKEREYNAASRYDGVKLGCSFVCGCAVYLLMGRGAMEGAIGCGSVILLYCAVTRLIEAVARTAEILTDLRNNNEHLLRYFRYMDLPEERSLPQERESEGARSLPQKRESEGARILPRMQETQAAPQPAEKRDGGETAACDIVFRNVSFRYPHSDIYALRNVNLRLRAGEKTAIVGENGSGKTTLVKLLCRLYRPASGSILLNGRDIWDYPYEEYTGYLAAVFQDFSLFAFSLAENVAGTKEYDIERVLAALEKAGLSELVAGYAKGIGQPLFHDFCEEGVDVSGGEAQKLAIARAVYKDARIMVLDEPTAALDPYAEYEIYENFGRIVQGKTVLFVSHRMSSCRMCDKIIVMRAGEAVQCGTHQELLADENGTYSRLWNAQAKYYA